MNENNMGLVTKRYSFGRKLPRENVCQMLYILGNTYNRNTLFAIANLHECPSKIRLLLGSHPGYPAYACDILLVLNQGETKHHMGQGKGYFSSLQQENTKSR